MSAAAPRPAVVADDRISAARRAARERPDIFWAVDEDAALGGPGIGPLAGLPIAVKDNYAVHGLPTRLGLPAPVARPDEDAWAVARLRSAGAAVVGTTAMDQLAFTMTGQAPGFPPLENPAAPGHLCGGSSGGSAAAVAAGIVTAALGTDTAGSVRLPAAWCGVVGIRPTPGLISLDGVAALAPSLDAAGVLGASVADCVAVLRALGVPAGAEGVGETVDGVACVVLGGAAPDWFTAAAEALLDAAGWRAVARPEGLPNPRIGRIIAAEFSAGWRDAEGVTEEVAAGLARGHGLDPDDVTRDRAALAQARAAAPAQLLGEGRLLLTPSSPGAAPRVGDTSSVAEASRYTRALGALGWPSASLPCGRVDGRPVGLQLSAAPGEDAFLLAGLEHAEQVIDRSAPRA